jgi:hypothetical protein
VSQETCRAPMDSAMPPEGRLRSVDDQAIDSRFDAEPMARRLGLTRHERP